MNKDFMKNKLLSNKVVAAFVETLRGEGCEAWIAGGAIRSVGTASLVNDYDIYFKNKESCVSAIQYMKEEKSHVAFISDKSITYVISNPTEFRNALGEWEPNTKIQLIFYDYYNTAEDIFKHFDFSCCCGAYSVLSEEFSYGESFWLHNSQRFLQVNTGTKFPLITGLRVDRYKQKGYTISRSEMMKVLFACASVKINSWKEFASQVGNLYGFNFLDEKALKDKTFSMELAMEILTGTNFDVTWSPAPSYTHSPALIEYVVADKPISQVLVDGKEYLPEISEDEETDVGDAIGDGTLTTEDITLQAYLGEFVYRWFDEDNGALKKIGEVTESSNYWKYEVFMKDKVRAQSSGVLVKCTYSESDLTSLKLGDIRFSKLTPVEIIGDKSVVGAFKEGKDIPKYKQQVKSIESGSFSCHGFELGCHTPTPDYISAKFREEHIRTHTKITGGQVKYARNSFSGIILEGGEDITAKELLLFSDSYNLCFGGEVSIRTDGTFQGSYNTD